uniref:Transposase, MuDR, MULE transposase domain protein n=1 Tax=Tanacetum cinerariifolium TaxID=118510 RepID=A0A6L2M1P9_TANCI|nr:transposase, MuDR, MULE transposase domain protein [Tanacetum cinerariifolium]
MVKMVQYEAFTCHCAARDVVLRESYQHETRGKLYYAYLRSKEERVRLLVGSPRASTTLIYSPRSSSTPVYSPGSSTPPCYSSRASTPPRYSLRTSRNAECSNCKHLLDKIMKFNLEANAEINFSFKLLSVDFVVDITDDVEVRDSPYEAFEMILYYCYNLEQKNERTVTRIKTDDKEFSRCYSLPLVLRHPAIAMAVKKEFPLAFHVVCCRHLMQNLSLKNKKRKGLFWKICKAYTREDYTTSMNILEIVQPDAYEKLCKAGPQRWSRAHCPLVRYNYMTSNSVESVNACSVIYTKEPVLKLAKTYRAMVQE